MSASETFLSAADNNTSSEVTTMSVYLETTNNTTNDSCETCFKNSAGRHFSGSRRTEQSVIIGICFYLGTCLFVSAIGNSVVIWVSANRLRKRHSTRFHVLVLSLAVSDILQGLFQVIPKLTEYIYGRWVCGVVICRITSVARTMLVNVSISTLAIIALERFIYIDKIGRGSNLIVFVMAVVAVWVIQCALAMPMGIWSTFNEKRGTCSVPVDLLEKTKDYTIIVRVVSYFVPFLIMWICNLGIIYKLRVSSLRIQPVRENNVADENRKKRSRHVTMMCLMLAFIFTINLTPFESSLIALSLADSQNFLTVLDVFRYTWLLTVLNSSLNPFIYSIFLKEFRQKITKMLSQTVCFKSKRFNVTSVTYPTQYNNKRTLAAENQGSQLSDSNTLRPPPMTYNQEVQESSRSSSPAEMTSDSATSGKRRILHLSSSLLVPETCQTRPVCGREKGCPVFPS